MRKEGPFSFSKALAVKPCEELGYELQTTVVNKPTPHLSACRSCGGIILALMPEEIREMGGGLLFPWTAIWAMIHSAYTHRRNFQPSDPRLPWTPTRGEEGKGRCDGKQFPLHYL